MDEKPFESMNVIPLVDIMMVLLVIVLTTSSFIASGRIPVNLPVASKSAAEAERNVVIEMNRAGAVYLNGTEMTPAALRAALEPLPKDTAFVIRADSQITLQRFVDVADLLRQLQFSKVAVQTKQ